MLTYWSKWTFQTKFPLHIFYRVSQENLYIFITYVYDKAYKFCWIKRIWITMKPISMWAIYFTKVWVSSWWKKRTRLKKKIFCLRWSSCLFWTWQYKVQKYTEFFFWDDHLDQCVKRRKPSKKKVLPLLLQWFE